MPHLTPTRVGACATTLAALLLTGAATAQEPPPAATEEAAEPVVVLNAGLKGGVNMNIMPEPDEDRINVPASTLFGVGFGGGLAVDAMAWDLVGLEIDVLLAKTEGRGEIDFSRLPDIEQTARSTDLHLALLLKLQTPSGVARPTLGLGATFVRQLSAEFEMDVPGVSTEPPDGELERNYTAFTSVLGVTADLGPVRLPFELRFLYHPVDTAPEERVAFPMTTGQPAYFAIYSDWAYQFWLMAGVQFSQGF